MTRSSIAQICLNCDRRHNFDCPNWNARDDDTCEEFKLIRPARSEA